VNLSFNELHNDSAWSDLWTSSCSVDQSVGFFPCQVPRCWIQSRHL